MTILATVYASHPADEIELHTLEIRNPARPTRYLCAGFENVTATLETGATVTFLASAMDLALPPKDASGNQALTFAVDNVVEPGQADVQAAIDDGGEVLMVHRSYLLSDLSAPASVPLVLTVAGGSFEGPTMTLQGMMQDLLNYGWPRLRYTADFAPGLRYAE